MNEYSDLMRTLMVLIVSVNAMERDLTEMAGSLSAGQQARFLSGLTSLRQQAVRLHRDIRRMDGAAAAELQKVSRHRAVSRTSRDN